MAVHQGFNRTSHCESWKIQCVSVPRQGNDCDCGVFVCQFIKYLVQGKDIPQWKDEEIGLLRKVIAWEMLEKRVRM